MEKLYYTIRELSETLNEKPHVLRYWEQKFDNLKAKKTQSGQKLYTKNQLEEFKFVQKQIRNNEITTAGIQKQIKDKNWTKEINENEILIEKFTNVAKGNIKAEDIVMLSKDEFKDLMDILKFLLVSYAGNS